MMKRSSFFASSGVVILFFLINNPLFAQKSSPRHGEDSTVTTRNVKLGGWIDAQYRFEQNSDTKSSVVQIRRARLDYKGSLSSFVDFRLQADFAPSPRLIDAYTKLNFNNFLQLQIGQFKIPFSMENKLSPLDLELIDNAQIISALSGYKDVSGVASYANGREIGVMLTGRLAYVTVRNEKMPLISYGVGLFGGNGINVKTDNLAKDVAARIDFYPFTRNVTLSVSGYWGNYEMLYSNSPINMNGVRNRFACGLQYADDHWTVRAEYLKGKTGFADYDEINDVYNPFDIQTQGCYLTTRYWFFYNNGQTGSFRQKISPMIRVEYYDKDMADNTSSMFYSTGVDWWPEKCLRFQLAYTVQQKRSSKQLGHTLTTMVTVKF